MRKFRHVHQSCPSPGLGALGHAGLEWQAAGGGTIAERLAADGPLSDDKSRPNVSHLLMTGGRDDGEALELLQAQGVRLVTIPCQAAWCRN